MTKKKTAELAGKKYDYILQSAYRWDNWACPKSRQEFLDKLGEMGYSKDNLETLQRVIDAEVSDLLAVLSYVSFMTPTVTRAERIARTRPAILDDLRPAAQGFPSICPLEIFGKGCRRIGRG